MNYATIKEHDTANGPGVRVSIFVSGCEHFCEGCFKIEAWDFDFGKDYNNDINEHLFECINHEYIRGLTILGGEPLHPRNQSKVLDIVKEFKHRYPDKDLWVYTGYLYEDLIENRIGDFSKEILENIDILVDGPFIIDLKDIGLNFRGSSNQRIIDVPNSILKNDVVIHPLGIGDANRYSKGD
jgi:anaerobic ribonucleoside-triphosphate reductase activating protein